MRGHAKIKVASPVILSSNVHSIPKDDYPVYTADNGTVMKGNKLADVWDSMFTISFTPKHLSMDRDFGRTKNGFNHGRDVGDGFSVFEEYRGFMIGGSYLRLDPEWKDVFIYSKLTRNDGVFVDDGDIGDAGALSDIYAHEIDEDEADRAGVVNFTDGNGYSAGKQYRIRVYAKALDDEDVDEGLLGEAIGFLYLGQEGECYVVPGNHIAELFDSSIAHEVGHVVGLAHHDTYAGIPAAPPEGEACVMITDTPDHLNDAEMAAWSGDGFVDFHEHADHGDWPDHWEYYKLHGRKIEDESHPPY